MCLGSPASQQVLVQSEIDMFAAGSMVMEEIMMAPTIEESGTYSLYFEYCEPKKGTPKGIYQTHHGLVGNAGYWNVKIEYVYLLRVEKRLKMAKRDDG